MENTLKADFSSLAMSIASSAMMSLGLAQDPTTQQPGVVNLDMARFNIGLLIMLQEKTNGNLSADEKKFLDSVVSDLQMRFVAAQKK